MLNRADVDRYEVGSAGSTLSMAAAAIAESRVQIERAHRMIAETRRLRVQTEAAIAASRRLLIEVRDILPR